MRALFTAIALTIIAAPASAQSDFGGLNLKVGQVVYVTDAKGAEIRGPIEAMSATSLQINGFRFGPDDTLRIDRAGDRSWDGALKGAGWGAALALGSDLDCRPCYARLVALSSAVGWVVDLGNVGRTRIFLHRTPSTADQVSASAAAVNPKPETLRDRLALSVDRTQPHDSIWGGVSRGAATAALVGAFFDNPRASAAIVGIGAGIGALTEHLHPPGRIVPFATPTAKGIAVSF